MANIYEGLSFAINTSPDLAESAFKLLKKGLEVETNDDRSLLGASHLMENISKVKPNLRDDILVLLPKILQSEKITEETSNQIQKIYINIQKEKNVARSQELKATLAERQGEKVLSPTEPTTHDSNSPTPTKLNLVLIITYSIGHLLMQILAFQIWQILNNGLPANITLVHR